MGNPTDQQPTPNPPSIQSSHANIWMSCADGDLETTQHLIESGQFLPSAQDDFGYSLLHAAASYNQMEIAQFLLDKDSNLVNLIDEDGDTPLHAVESVDMAAFLLNAGASPNPLNNCGLTPLDLAIEDDRLEVIDFFKALYTRLCIPFELPPIEPDQCSDDELGATLSDNISRHLELASSNPEQAQLCLAVEDLVMCQLGLDQQSSSSSSSEPDDD